MTGLWGTRKKKQTKMFPHGRNFSLPDFRSQSLELKKYVWLNLQFFWQPLISLTAALPLMVPLNQSEFFLKWYTYWLWFSLWTRRVGVVRLITTHINTVYRQIAKMSDLYIVLLKSGVTCFLAQLLSQRRWLFSLWCNVLEQYCELKHPPLDWESYMVCVCQALRDIFGKLIYHEKFDK